MSSNAPVGQAGLFLWSITTRSVSRWTLAHSRLVTAEEGAMVGLALISSSQGWKSSPKRKSAP